MKAGICFLSALTMVSCGTDSSSSFAQGLTFPTYRFGNSEDFKPSQPLAGAVFIKGGGGETDGPYRDFLQRANRGDVVVIKAYEGDDYNEYFASLTPLNSVTTLVINNPNAANDPYAVEKIKNAEAVFLGGGDQHAYYRAWNNTAMHVALKERIAEGMPIGGTSAGLAVLSEYAYVWDGSARSADALQNPFHKEVGWTRNFFNVAALKNIFADSHFAERDRFGRLITFMSRILTADPEKQIIYGMGVDERTSVLIDSNLKQGSEVTGVVLGEGSVYFYELNRNDVITCEANTPLDVRQFQVHRLKPGMRFYLNDWLFPQAAEVMSWSVSNGVLMRQKIPKV